MVGSILLGLLACTRMVETTGQLDAVDIVYSIDDARRVFRGECRGSIRSLIQKAHVQCAVGSVSNLLSCREQLVSAVLEKCIPSPRQVPRAKGEGFTFSDAVDSSLCQTKPLPKALTNFFMHMSEK